jgi:aspartyl-tRNA(Asn)/glutamyl-tRNA(Gln) amidotransferase subunit B
MYEPVIGLEVHLQLKTRTKIFCGCLTDFGAEPNTQVCPVCLGFPGSLPVLNRRVLEFAVRVGLALNCQVQEFTKFARKHYFYPDLPKAYQISQFDLPLCAGGYVDILVDGAPKRIGITRAHLEEDAGKLVHKEDSSYVDYNRCGVPLLEIVSQPDLRSPAEAYEYLTALKNTVEYLDVSDCDMEKGSLRCDANISVRKKGVQTLGTKTEIKNLNSFRAVRDALCYEIQRHQEVLESGGAVTHETRLWDPIAQTSQSMRSKEDAKDYHYFPEPDLSPLVLKDDYVNPIRKSLPELPQAKKERFIKEYGVPLYEAGILVAAKKDALFAEECLREEMGSDKKLVTNWLVGPMLAEANARASHIADLGVGSKQLVELVGFVRTGEISNLSGKTVLSEMITSRKSAQEIIREKNLIQISDSASLDGIIAEVLAQNARSIDDFKAGKENALMFLVGQAMKKSKGKANPKVVQDLLRRRLSDA